MVAPTLPRGYALVQPDQIWQACGMRHELAESKSDLLATPALRTPFGASPTASSAAQLSSLATAPASRPALIPTWICSLSPTSMAPGHRTGTKRPCASSNCSGASECPSTWSCARRLSLRAGAPHATPFRNCDRTSCSVTGFHLLSGWVASSGLCKSTRRSGKNQIDRLKLSQFLTGRRRATAGWRMAESDLAPLLVAKAQDKLLALGTIVDQRSFSTAIIGFHAQQAVEKPAKAWLILLLWDPLFTYDLREPLFALEQRGGRETSHWRDFSALNHFAA
ncbi:MAG: HEPN domain-containing protein [Myxococcales bacterium]|nr:HEPN domain-containing protein [Myxococcales bacterium]